MPDDPRQCWDYIQLAIEESILTEFHVKHMVFSLTVRVNKESLPKGLILDSSNAHNFSLAALHESEVVAPIRAALKSWDKLPEGW